MTRFEPRPHRAGPARGPLRASLALTVAMWATALVLHMPALAATVGVGSTLPQLTLTDQHDKPVVIGPGTRWLVFASEKPVSDMVNGVLSAEPAARRDGLQLVVVADISGMPALITRMFALPKLRELPFPMALVRDPAQRAQVADLPRHPGRATLVQMEGGRITQTLAVAGADELRMALGLAALP